MSSTGQMGVKASVQYLQNESWDTTFGTLVVQGLLYDGQNIQRPNADNLSLKMTIDGSVTYIATAAPGTAQATAKWQCRKLDETSGLVITWADGDADFDNVATDLTSLSYS